MESNSKTTMFSDGNEMFARVEVKQEHCCSETIKSETEDSVQSYTYMRKSNFSSEPFMDKTDNDVKFNDFEKIEIKQEPYCLESTAIEGKFQAELSPVSLKIDIKETVPFMNGAGEVTPSTELRICSEPSTVALKTLDCIEITKEDVDCETDATNDTGDTGSIVKLSDIELPHKCQICGKSYRIPSLLKKHLKISHNDNRRFKCEICDRKFNWLSTMNSHMLIHEGKKPHKCQFCWKSFTRMYHLKMHILAHEGKKPHKCNICDKSFTEPSNLRKHSLIHEGKKPFKCEICEKSFTQLVNLKLHNLMHEGKRPHKCDTCQKKFTHISHLRLHTLIHGGLKPHKCELCEKRFIYVSHLRKHRAIHEAKKTFKCDTCGKHFTGIGYLNNHMLIHEGKNPPK